MLGWQTLVTLFLSPRWALPYRKARQLITRLHRVFVPEAAVNPTPHGNAVTDFFTKEDDYTELSDADVEDIETVLRRLQDNLSRSGTRAADLSFPGLTGTFVISGNLAHLLPQSPERVNPRFLVYTNRDGSEDVAAKAPVLEVGFEHRDNFSAVARALDVDQKLYFVVHGFHSRARARWVQHIKNEILAVVRNARRLCKP